MIYKNDKNSLKKIDKHLKDTLVKHENIEVPKELNLVVEDAILEGTILNERKRIYKKPHLFTKTVVALAAVMIFLLNTSPVFAQTMQDIPVVGELFKLFTFREYHYEDDIKYIDVKVPHFTSEGKNDLENRVNREIEYFINEEIKNGKQEAKDYYDAFIATGGKKEDFIPVGITIGYEVYKMDSSIASFSIYKYETAFNAYNKKKFYNIDMKSGKIITIKDYLGNDYKSIIVKGIKDEITSWTKEQKEALWQDLDIESLIDENTKFYINKDSNPVIIFEKYEVAEGAMGEVKFTIEIDKNNKKEEVK